MLCVRARHMSMKSLHPTGRWILASLLFTSGITLIVMCSLGISIVPRSGRYIMSFLDGSLLLRWSAWHVHESTPWVGLSCNPGDVIASPATERLSYCPGWANERPAQMRAEVRWIVPRLIRMDYPPEKVLIIPLWPFALLSLGLAAACLYRIWVLSSRMHTGLCTNCGYDLRASEGRCPECGLVTGGGIRMGAEKGPGVVSVAPSDDAELSS